MRATATHAVRHSAAAGLPQRRSTGSRGPLVRACQLRARNSLSHQVAGEVRKFFGDKVYQTQIPRNVTLGEAPSHGKSALLYDARSKGAQSYLALAMELLDEACVG